jgi:tripartite ATP-independent transporter DctM subunit
MLKVGYDQRLAAGVVAVAGTLSAMIPPSILMVIYGITTETEIGKLLIAGIIPGIITAFMYAIGIFIWVKLCPSIAKPIPRSSWYERFEMLKGLGPLLILVFVVIGGMFFGLVTPSEAAALGALGALVICLIMRRIDRKGIILALKTTVRTTAMIFMIVIGAMIFGYYLALVQATQGVIGFIGGLQAPPWVILMLVVISYVVMGALFDELAMLLITLPLTFPLITNLGYDPVWFGVIIIALCEIGLAAPPVGMTAFVVSAVSKIPLDLVYRGSTVMLIFEFIAMLLFILFPEIVLFLPNRMFK